MENWNSSIRMKTLVTAMHRGIYRSSKVVVAIADVWIKSSKTLLIQENNRKTITGCVAGNLKRLDLTKINTPLIEIREYLLAKYKERFTMRWELFEDVVGSVFKSMGYHVQVTGRSNDGGIDVFLESPDNKIIGVQVKKYKNKIKVKQIRSLTGALVQKGITKGVFVTTSEYQPSAETAAALSSKRGYPIELINSKRFYEALQITKTDIRDTMFCDITPAKMRMVKITSNTIDNQ